MNDKDRKSHILVEHIVRVTYFGEAMMGQDGITRRESHIISEKVISSERGEIKFSSEAQTE